MAAGMPMAKPLTVGETATLATNAPMSQAPTIGILLCTGRSGAVVLARKVKRGELVDDPLVEARDAERAAAEADEAPADDEPTTDVESEPAEADA